MLLECEDNSQLPADEIHGECLEPDELAVTARDVTGLSCDTTYRFWVSARGNGGRYANGNWRPTPLSAASR